MKSKYIWCRVREQWRYPILCGWCAKRAHCREFQISEEERIALLPELRFQVLQRKPLLAK